MLFPAWLWMVPRDHGDQPEACCPDGTNSGITFHNRFRLLMSEIPPNLAYRKSEKYQLLFWRHGMRKGSCGYHAFAV